MAASTLVGHKRDGASMNDQSQCTNNRVPYGILPVKNGLGARVVLKCHETSHNITEHVPTSTVDNRAYCSVCQQTFYWPGDLKRHKCLAERSWPVKEQQGAIQCSICHCKSGLAVHKCKAAEVMS